MTRLLFFSVLKKDSSFKSNAGPHALQKRRVSFWMLEHVFQCDTWVFNQVLQLQGTNASEWSRVTEKKHFSFISCFERWEMLILLAELHQHETGPLRNAVVTTPVLQFLVACCLFFVLEASDKCCSKETEKDTERNPEQHETEYIFFCHWHTHTHTPTHMQHGHLSQTIHWGLWQWLTEQDMCSPRWLKLQN